MDCIANYSGIMIKLYIHIGTHKTGTTTIQKKLRENNEYLEKENITFFYKPEFLLKLSGSKLLEKKYIEKGYEGLVQWIKEGKRKGINTFVVSHEDLSGNWRSGYKNSKTIAKSLQLMIKDLHADVKIIVYLRRQDTFMESLYAQNVQSGNPNTFRDFKNSYDSTAFNWYELLNNYAEFFGKDRLIVRRYSKKELPDNDSLIQNFGKIIGSKFLENLFDSEPLNQSYNHDALEIARLTAPYIDRYENDYLRSIFQRINSKQPFDNYSFFDPSERIEFLSNYKDSNKKVAIEYFNDQTGKLFDDITHEEDNFQPYPGLKLEPAIITLTKALIVLSQENSQIKMQLSKKNDSGFRKKIKRKIRNLLRRYI